MRPIDLGIFVINAKLLSAGKVIPIQSFELKLNNQTKMFSQSYMKEDSEFGTCTPSRCSAKDVKALVKESKLRQLGIHFIKKKTFRRQILGSVKCRSRSLPR